MVPHELLELIPEDIRPDNNIILVDIIEPCDSVFLEPDMKVQGEGLICRASWLFLGDQQ